MWSLSCHFQARHIRIESERICSLVNLGFLHPLTQVFFYSLIKVLPKKGYFALKLVLWLDMIFKQKSCLIVLVRYRFERNSSRKHSVISSGIIHEYFHEYRCTCKGEGKNLRMCDIKGNWGSRYGKKHVQIWRVREEYPIRAYSESVTIYPCFPPYLFSNLYFLNCPLPSSNDRAELTGRRRLDQFFISDDLSKWAGFCCCNISGRQSLKLGVLVIYVKERLMDVEISEIFQRKTLLTLC